MLKVELDVVEASKLVDEGLVQLGAVGGADEAAVGVVGLRLLGGSSCWRARVDHAAVHGDCGREDAGEEGGTLGVFEGGDASG